MPHKWNGPGARTKLTMATIKHIAEIQKGLPLTIKIKKPRKEHKVYDFAEKKMRQELSPILRKLKRQGKIEFWRIEPWGSGEWNIPDYWVFSFITNWAGWIELKSKIGIIRPKQQKFADNCYRMGVKHIFARSINNIMEVING